MSTQEHSCKYLLLNASEKSVERNNFVQEACFEVSNDVLQVEKVLLLITISILEGSKHQRYAALRHMDVAGPISTALNILSSVSHR